MTLPSFGETGIVRVMCALKLLSDTLPQVADRTFRRKYIALGRIVTHWEAIAGADLAGKAQPVKIHYRKTGAKGEKPQTRLDIAVAGAYATALHYRKDLILERINRIFGEAWICDIRFVTPQATGIPVKKPRKATKPLTGKEKEALSGMLAGISDPEMKERLNNLGTALMQDQRRI